jgi:hypothetical protein
MDDNRHERLDKATGGRIKMLRLLAVAITAVAVPCAALASAVVETTSGPVLADGAPVFKGQTLLAEANITTGPGAQVLLRFDDGMHVALNENSRLRLVDFRYNRGPNDRVVMDLLQGGARVSTGRVAAANPKQFFLRSPQAQFGVQGPADFAVVLVNPAFLTVNVGTVLASNGAGTVAFGAGATATVATSGALATPIAASAFPQTAASAFGNLQAAAVAAPGGASGGALAAGGAAGGAGFGVAGPVVVFGAAVAGAAGALKSDDASATTHH